VTGERSRRDIGLAGRLFGAQTLIAIVGALTLWLVTSAIGPGIFHTHLKEIAGHVSADTSKHVEEAFTSASAISITVALVASLVAALAVSAYVSRRIAGPVARLAVAARRVATGRYDTRVPLPALGADFATLTTSFNAMAAELESVETTRRRLLADLAHEMRTPVATLDAYLEGMEDGFVTVDAETVTMLRTQTARLTRLAEDITAVSRAEEHQLDMHLQSVMPAQLVATSVDAFRDRYAEREVTLTNDVQPDLPVLWADSERLGQVLGNLLDNALRHTPAGGNVSVIGRAGDDAVTLTVTDSGAGIPREQLPHVFERFYRVDRARDRAHGGSGIGLAIVKALVEAHGGTVTAASDGSGCGATFTVTLPTVSAADTVRAPGS
jgi:two-component system, OmpR family, sensor histidine kinase BaeS